MFATYVHSYVHLKNFDQNMIQGLHFVNQSTKKIDFVIIYG